MGKPALGFKGVCCVMGAKGLAIAIGMWFGLTVAGHADSTHALSAQVVVQFTDNVTEPNNPEFIDDLATKVGAPLAYVRPSGANGHVLMIHHLGSQDQLDKALAQLAADQDVVSVRKRVAAPAR